MISGNETRNSRLGIVSFGMAIGVAEGMYMLCFAWMACVSGFGLHLILTLSAVMPGYAPTFIGGLIGAIEGFIDGFIFGIIASSVYNICMRCQCGKPKS